MSFEIERVFTKDSNVFDQFDWSKRDAIITGKNGEVVFEQKGVVFPTFWSDRAVNIVASRYFYGHLDSPDREYSLKQLVNRVVSTITRWLREEDYFDSKTIQIVSDELTYMLVSQMFAFNSPVWFNLGTPNKHIASACYINDVEDNLDSILDLVKKEGKIFKAGSGSGTNLSRLRGKEEPLTGRGASSGVISFMKLLDTNASTLRSGGKVRRSALLRCLDVNHPDIEEFITCKSKEEEKVKALIAQGYSADFDGEAYQTVAFQNANNSVMITDTFMKCVENDSDFELVYRGPCSDKLPVKKVKARALFRLIASEAWKSGDPGVMFYDTINKMNTCSHDAPIISSNPCGEFLFLENNSCTLGSLNLTKFLDKDLNLNLEEFNRAISIATIALDTIVGNADYPFEHIAKTNKKYRTIGLGFSNFAAYLMLKGIPYESFDAQNQAALISAYITVTAYQTSQTLAHLTEPFPAYNDNKRQFRNVIRRHIDSLKELRKKVLNKDFEFFNTIASKFHDLDDTLEEIGVRNAQVTCIAPCGTISFMMDCTTTGIEPELALVKYKQLHGGGVIETVNDIVYPVLCNLGYHKDDVQLIQDYIQTHKTIEGSRLKPEHLPIFDCAFKPFNGKRFISPNGHIDMLASVFPFISMGISKTVNLPSDVTVEDIEDIYMSSWKKGLKSITIYRDGCKMSQPLNVSKPDEKTESKPQEKQEKPKEILVSSQIKRERLPDTRNSITHKFQIGNYDGYLTVGLYPDGKPGEIFINTNKEGSTLSGMMDSFATVVSIALQYGVPLDVIANKMINLHFEPYGWTSNPEIRNAKSLVDYIFRWLQQKFTKINSTEDLTENTVSHNALPMVQDKDYSIVCPECGSITIPNGGCHVCPTCGHTTGCS